MAWEAHLDVEPGATAGSDFSTGNGYQSTGQFLFVKRVSGSPNVFVPCTNKYDIPAGVSQTNPGTIGDALSVGTKGYTKIVAGGTLHEGDEVGTDANGKAVAKAPSTTGANLGEYIRGDVVEGCSTGELATIRLKGPYVA